MHLSEISFLLNYPMAKLMDLASPTPLAIQAPCTLAVSSHIYLPLKNCVLVIFFPEILHLVSFIFFSIPTVLSHFPYINSDLTPSGPLGST